MGKELCIAGNGCLVLRDNQGTNARGFRQQQPPSLSQRHSTPPAVQMGLNEAAISMHSHFQIPISEY